MRKVKPMSTENISLGQKIRLQRERLDISLEQLAEGRTTFTIAHRLTTIKNAKVIWVLTEDGVAEQGSHEELLARRGIYYQLYNA